MRSSACLVSRLSDDRGLVVLAVLASGKRRIHGEHIARIESKATLCSAENMLMRSPAPRALA